MKAWWSAQELAAEALPGLPHSKAKINAAARKTGWASRTDAQGQALARRRKGRGGGVEYHFHLLPFHAREVLIARGLVKAPPAEEGDINALLALAAEMRALQVASRLRRSAALVAQTQCIEEAFDRALMPFRTFLGGEV